MKKFYYLATGIVMVLVTIMACEKSAIGVDEIQTLSKEEVLLSKGDDKVTICHWDAEEGMWYQITIAQEAVDKHFANHGDKFPYSPEGVYVFKFIGQYSHHYTIDFFDGINFTGYGGYPAGDETYAYPFNQILSGTVIDGVLSGMTTYEDDRKWYFTGTVDACGGIVSLDGDWELIE